MGEDTQKHQRWKRTSTPFRIQFKRPTLIKTGTSSWFEQLSSNEDIPSPVQVSQDLISDLRLKAKDLLNKDLIAYKSGQNKSDFAWVERVLHGGTLADKMAAHTTLIQDSPVHNLTSLDALLALVNIKAKRECLMAMDTLKDLFVNLLPENRKLRKFELQPLSSLEELSSGNRESNDRRLILWHFEDVLQDRYKSFLVALDKVSHDSVDKTKQKAIYIITQLLASNPEQEQFLLSLLINKLGDPVQQVAGKVVHSVTILLEEHPNMKGVIVQEIERFLYRPHLKEKAQYYALCCLNQILLDKEDSELAMHLVKVYLGFFRSCLNKDKGKKTKKKEAKEVDLRIMSATLTGLSRAAPYTSSNNTVLGDHLNELYALLPKVPFNVRTQALALLYQVQDGGNERFYCALYRTLLEPSLQGCTRQAVFLNLLYRCLKRDPAIQRVKAFTKRILQICHYLPASISCSLLVVLSQVFQDRPEIAVTKMDPMPGTTKENGISCFMDDDDEEEHYQDLPDESEETTDKTPALEDTKPPKSSSWVHVKNSNSQQQKHSDGYDPKHRNPLYCMGGENNTPYWELGLLVKHFHPSVALFSRNLNAGEASTYSGDPLQDFTLLRFLERFVYRNPKQTQNQQGNNSSTAKEPSKVSVFGKRKLYMPMGLRNVPVQSEQYLQQSLKIPEEERFLYEYRLLENQKRKEEDDDAASVTSEDFQSMLDHMEPGTMEKMDFSSAFKETKKAKSNKEEEDFDEDDLEDLEDSEDDFAKDEDFQKEFEEYDGDLQDLGDFEAEDFDKLDRITRTPKSKKKNDSDLGQLFASAEQFSGMIEDQVDKGVPSSTTIHAVANKDKSDAKQLIWEQKRQLQSWHGKKRKGPQKGFKKQKRMRS